jgi:protein-S-isoprenylcysteine O-methyltransferase Ste14
MTAALDDEASTPAAAPAGARSGWQRRARRLRVPLGFLVAALYFWLAQPSWASLAIGAAIAACGIAIRAAAAGHVRKDAELTTTGPYSYTRNPLYLGSAVLALGFAIAGRNAWMLLVLGVFFIAVYWPVIRSEEEFLRGRFPEFDAYAREVPRFFPRLRGRAGTFSGALYRKHREYRALLGALALLAALVAKMYWAGTAR